MKTITWKSRCITIQNVYSNYKQSNWIIPSYQRGFVWNDKKIRDLIDSILKGFPLGSVLIWRTSKTSYVLDGQQRTISILKVREKPFKYLDYKSLKYIDFDNVMESEEKSIKDAVKILSCKSLDEILDKMEISDETKELIPETSSSAKKLLETYINYFTDSHKEKNVINKIELANMDSSDAIILFERLNLNGIKLNDFEVLSAKWSETKLSDKDLKLLESNKELYRSFYSEIGMKYEDIKEFENKIVTPAEFIYATFLSAFKEGTFFRSLFITITKSGTFVLNSKDLTQLLWIYRYILYKKTGEDKWLVEHKVNDFNLGEELAKQFSSEEELINLQNCIKTATKNFELYVKPLMVKNPQDEYMYIKSSKGKNLPIIALAQIIWKELEGENISEAEWVKISIWVLKYWFSQAFSSNTTPKIINSLKKEEYFSPISFKDLEKEIEVLENNQRNTPDSRGFNDISKYIIYVTYKDTVGMSFNKFEFDHVIPFSEISKTYQLGRNSIGNSALLTKRENGDKSNEFDPLVHARDPLSKLNIDVNSEQYEKKLKDVKKSKYSKLEVDALYDYRFEHIKKGFIKKIETITTK